MLAAVFAVAVLSTTTTTSIGVATPVFAAVNCTPTTGDPITCTGGSSFKSRGIDASGGSGGRTVTDQVTGVCESCSGGTGQNNDVAVGGIGRHLTCTPGVGCNNPVPGGEGIHFKGPGGNSDDPLP
jgi:hypothetical protein